MRDDIRVVIAGEADWQRVRTLRLAALLDAPDAFASTYEKECLQPPEWWQGRLCSGTSSTFLVTHAGEDCGMAVLGAYNEVFGAGLYAVWVAPAHRGCGVGDALIRSVIAHARSLGRLSIALDVALTNHAARALYERHGFVSTGELSTLPPPRAHICDVQYVLRLDGPVASV